MGKGLRPGAVEVPCRYRVAAGGLGSLLVEWGLRPGAVEVPCRYRVAAGGW